VLGTHVLLSLHLGPPRANRKPVLQLAAAQPLSVVQPYAAAQPYPAAEPYPQDSRTLNFSSIGDDGPLPSGAGMASN